MKCKIENCVKEALPGRKGMCTTHYTRLFRYGDPNKGPKPKVEVQCSVAGCLSTTKWENGLCIKHYKQRWYLNSVGKEEIEIRLSSERWIHQSTGYVLIKHEGKLCYEHRVLAEKALGKPLPKGAIVHHTGARDDNHGPFKLVICPDQEYHLLLHKRMEEGYGKDN